MPRLHPKPIHNAYQASIIKNKQRFTITIPVDIGRYVIDKKGTLKGSFTISEGKMIFWIRNLKIPLKEKLERLKEEEKG